MKKIVLSMLMVVILVMNTVCLTYALSPSGEDESNIALASATPCPRCGVGELKQVCSGDHAYYNYADCWTAGRDHPYNCQTHQDIYYTDTVCNNGCGYDNSGTATETHVHAYDHTMYPSCADPNYCRYK